MYRNAQLRYTQIGYCTLWEECKQTQCPHRSWRKRTNALMWYYSPTKNNLIYQVRANAYDFWIFDQYGKYNSIIFLFHPLGSFPSKMMRCPWILCFDLPLQYTDLTHQIWWFLVYIFLALDQGYNVRKVNFSCVYSAYILKPVLSGWNL